MNNPAPARSRADAIITAGIRTGLLLLSPPSPSLFSLSASLDVPVDAAVEALEDDCESCDPDKTSNETISDD